MNIKTSNDSKENIIFYPYWEESTLLPAEILSKISEDKDYFTAKGQVRRYFLSNKNILVIHLGKKEKVTLESFRQFLSSTYKIAKKELFKSFDVTLCYDGLGLKKEDVFYSSLEGLLLSDYEYDKFKSSKNKKFKVEDVTLIIEEIPNSLELINKAKLITESVFMTRDLVNGPANFITIDYMEDFAKEIAGKDNLKFSVIREEQLLKDGFNLLHSVGKGSVQRPRLIELEYFVGNDKPTICLIGKGIIFDTGGLNIKPENFMSDMKSDMAGSATVLSLIHCISNLKLPINVVSLLPMAENAVDGNSYRPGDVIIAYNKKSVEILNTDAEGRLILSDALSYSDTKKPDLTIDFATLTGAAIIALGTKIATVYFRDEKYKQKMFDASKKSGEAIWELPLFEDYKENLKADIADVANLGTPSRQAGSIMGALFLSEFIENQQWIHFDLAGTAFFDKEWNYNPKGGTGFILRTIVEFLGKM